MLGRREFVKMASAAAGCAACVPTAADAGSGREARIAPVAGSPETGRAYPGWKPGEMDLHFVYTGRGENMFYIFPDGTTMVNDTGDYYRTREIPHIPWHPRRDLLGGEAMARYISRLMQSREIDYMTVSHWHTDHVGDPGLGYRTAKDGRKVCGLALLAETFKFARYFDHQYPNQGQYGSADQSLAMMQEFLKSNRAKGIAVERFRPGALNQIRLLHDSAGRYGDTFSIRNVCANAVCWTGKGEETIDYGAIHAKATGMARISNQNTLSMGFLISYGKFRYWTGGDVSGKLKDASGGVFEYEDVVGRAVGPVTVCKTNHHSWKDAMGRSFVERVKAAAYVTAVWSPSHVQDGNMRWMSSRELYPGERIVLPTFVPEKPRQEWPEATWWRDMVTGGGHVIVKVLPGGDAFKIYQVESADETMRVKAVFKGRSDVLAASDATA